MTEITGLSTTDSSNTEVTGESIDGAIANMGRMDNTLQAILGLLARSIRTNVLRFLDATDSTKRIAFDLSALPTATTRTLKFTPNGAVDTAFGVIRIQDFTSNGTYTPNQYMVSCLIQLVGAGGGGGGCTAAAASGLNGAGGGGGGAYAEFVFPRSTIGASQAVSIGAFGAGGAAGNNPGTFGGATSVGTLISADGGNGGNGATAAASGTGGLGGTGGTLALFVGATGGSGATASSLNVNGPIYGGSGGNSPFGFGGRSSVNTAGLTGSGYGSGGGGASDFNATSARAGGNGTPGFVRIIEFCSQ